MAQENFIRRYLMKAGKMGHNGFQIGQTSTENPHALHISFSIEKSTSETANTAKVQIWNLSPANLSILDTKDCTIELQAGYANHIALILAGNVVTSSTEMDGADRMTEIEVVDGRVALRDTYISISRSGKVNSKEVFDQIAGEMGVSVVYSKGCKFKTLPHGFSYVGAAKTALKKLCKTCGLKWSIQNSVLQIRKPNEAITTRAYLLSTDTAEGVSLDNAVQYGGIRRSPNKYSYYTLHCTGDDGTIVRQGATVATNTAPQAKLAAVSEFVITRESFNKVSIRVSAPITGAIYSVSINGVQYSFTSVSDDELSIIEGLSKAVNPDGYKVSVNESNITLDVISESASRSGILVLSDNLTTASVTTLA